MPPLSEKSFLQRHGIALLGGVFIGFYLLGIAVPDLWWSSHWLAFLPTFWQYSLVALVLVLGGLAFRPQLWEGWVGTTSSFRLPNGSWIRLGIALLMGILMYQLPIVGDFYGDSTQYFERFDEMVDSIPKGTNEAFFNFSLKPWEGRRTFLSLVTYLAYFGGINYGKAFLWLDVLLGIGFVWLWLSFISKQIQHHVWQLILSLAGISAPFMLIFYGHNESYSLVFLTFLAWFVVVIRWIEQPGKRGLWAIIVLTLLCIKFHPIALLFLPSLAMMLWQHYMPAHPMSSRLSNWWGIGKWILIPIFASGLILYFFVFEDFQDDRSLAVTASTFDHLFLPLLSPEPPLDRYNILSLNHLFDVFAGTLIWSPVMVLIGLSLLIFYRKNIDWNEASIRVSGLIFILLASLLFAVNPLLSYPIDWDLMSIPTVAFLVLVVRLVRQVEQDQSLQPIFPPSLALILCCLPVFVVFSQEKLHSQRLEQVGIRVYHTYYDWSGKVLTNGLYLYPYASRAEYEARKAKLLAQLQPDVREGKDSEFAFLIQQDGLYYLRQNPDYDKALVYFKEAEQYEPGSKSISLNLLELHFRRKEFQLAYNYGIQLIELAYPSKREAIRTALHCALEGGLYTEAQALSSRYLQEWQEDPLVQEVAYRLQQNLAVDSLKYLFARTPN